MFAIACAAALSGCEFLGLDMFPAELQNLEAEADLAAMAAGEGWTLTRAMRIEALHSPASGKTHVFAAMETMSGLRLLILDEAGLAKQKAIYDPNLNAAMGVDALGNFLCGRVRVYSNNLAYDSPPGGLFDSNKRLAFLTNNAVFYSSDSITVSMDRFDIGWAAAPVSQIGKQPFATVAGEIRVLDLMLHKNGEISLLVGGMNNVSDIRFAGETALNNAFLLTSLELGAASVTTIPQRVADGQAWLTEDGIVALNRDRETRLVRYVYGTGAEKDSKTIESEWMSGFSFEPSGKYWYYYDNRTGRLRKLRTWWK